MRKLLLTLAMLLAAPLAAQADDIALGEPGYGGNGCPAGTVSATLSPDAKSLSLIFDGYQAAVGGSTGLSLDRKSCNIAIPVHVPNGRSISIIKIDYRGYNGLPQQATSAFNVEYFFAGTRGPRFQRTFNGPLDAEYLITNQLTADAIVWSPCGADVNLRVNSSIRVQTRQNRDALATVDSADVNAGIVYHYQWREC